MLETAFRRKRDSPAIPRGPFLRGKGSVHRSVYRYKPKQSQNWNLAEPELSGDNDFDPRWLK